VRKCLIVICISSIFTVIFAGCEIKQSDVLNTQKPLMDQNVSMKETQKPQENEGNITKEDEKAVHDVIVAYFKAIENKDYSTAWEIFSSEMKKSSTKNDANQNHFGIESIKLISIQTYLRPQEAKENENKPTINFEVKLDIVPNQQGAWDKGINERFVGVVKEQGQWKINALATSP
jgi:hypothetical protein